ncbi:MAG: non-homologous end-joining DNA ligase [Myxococcota bacterium]
MTRIEIESHVLSLSNLDKVLFPDVGLTKGDLIDHYRGVAALLLPHARDRALTLHRFPDGIDQPGFYQQQRSSHFPDWIPGVTVPRVGDPGDEIPHVVCNDEATLVYLANQAVVTLHGWTSRCDRIDRPDRLVFDLDPPDGDSFAAVVVAARRVRDLMQAIGLTPFVMTTGSKGLHVVAPLDAGSDFDAVRSVARAMAEVLTRRHPDTLTIAQRKSERRDRLYLDVSRNAWGQTSVLPYSVRAKPGAPVATPVDWHEIGRKGFESRRYSVQNLRRRLARKDDPWADIDRHATSLEPVREALLRLEDVGDAP